MNTCALPEVCPVAVIQSTLVPVNRSVEVDVAVVATR
jgi:hypothetical protein